MSKKLPVHKNTEHPADALWWRPMFAMQKEMNDVMVKTAPYFLSPALMDGESNAFSLWQENIHRLFSEMFNNRQMVSPWLTGGRTKPYVNITEDQKAYTVEANVPGLSAEDLDIAVSDSALTIGGYTDEQCHDGESFLHRECCEGSFCRTVALPDNADTDKASATLDNNVLRIHVPKKTEGAKKARKLEILSSVKGQTVPANDKKKAA